MKLGNVFRDYGGQRTKLSAMRVVEHRPMVRALALAAFASIMAAGALGGYLLGQSQGEVDGVYLHSLERLRRSHLAEIAELRTQLADAELGRRVTAQASEALREDIKDAREEVAELTQEVTFYKSLMAPGSVERGLRIADFELDPTDSDDQFAFHVLLTQVEARRSWVQGDLRVEVRGRRVSEDGEGVEQVLSLTELADLEAYPLKFRFRYFQDLTGEIRIPPGFQPEAVVVTARQRGGRGDELERTFGWSLR